MTHKNTVKTRRARENSAILEETQSQCTVGRRSLLLWMGVTFPERAADYSLQEQHPFIRQLSC